MVAYKSIDEAIKKAKEELDKKAKETGYYENFGAKEILEIEDKYLDLLDFSPPMMEVRRKIHQFIDWCHIYPAIIEEEKK